MMNAAAGIFLAARRKPRLPYDAEVEHLESTGTQWIDSGIISEDVVSYEVRFKLGSTYTGAGIFGALVQGSETTNNRVLQYKAENIIIVQRGSYSTSSSVPLDYNWHTASSSSSQIVIDSTTFSSRSCTNGGAFMALFSSGNVDTAVGQGSVLISHARIWASDVLVRDFIPVRFTNEQGVSEGAMYDRANPTVGMNPDGSPRDDGLYRNRGTGAFLYGADKTA